MTFWIYKDVANEWRWFLMAANNEKIASGEGYKNKADCLAVIRLIQSVSPHAPIKELP